MKLLFPWWIWWGEIAVQSSFPTLQTADDIDVEQLFLLWHFDPWGVVASLEPKHRWSRGLTSANCLNRFVLKQGTVSSVWYTGDLLRLGLVEKKYLGSTELKRYDRTMLPTREDEAEGIAAQIRFEWRLTPFWLSE